MTSLRPAFALLPLFLLLIVANVESRKDLGEYWKLVMKDQDIGEFEPRPNASAYGDNEIHAKENMGPIGEFEQRPNVSAYGNNEIHANENKGVIGEFEPRPNASAYGDNEIGAEFTDDFEPRPNMTKYNA
ncbi:unnamed protein product [Lathyrus oleraceus]